MPRQRQRQLGGGNPAAIVAHAGEAHPARFDFHLDTLRAPASRLFSTSSLTMEAGRSMTSPAAIWSMRWLSRMRMGMGGAQFTAPPAAQERLLPQFDLRAGAPALRRVAARRVPSGALP